MRTGTEILLLLAVLVSASAQEPPPRRPIPAPAKKAANVQATPEAGRDEAVAADRTRRDYGKNCLTSGCHAQLNKAPFVHGPILVTCEKCHVAEGRPEDHRYRLTQPIETLCTSCHKPPAAEASVHEPYVKGKCDGCHDPHKGNTRALLTAPTTREMCVKCHPMAEEKNLHGPMALGECLLCHSSHQSKHAKLAILPGKDLCFKCHTEVQTALTEASHVHGPASVDCGACHASHGSEEKLLLKKDLQTLCRSCHDSVEERLSQDPHVHGALKDEKGCAACHTSHASQFAFQLRAAPTDLCLGCHNKEMIDPQRKSRVANVADEILKSKFKHGPVRTGDCQGCHFSHSAKHADLLHEDYPARFYEKFSAEGYALCFRCHEKTLVLDERTTTLTRFRDGDRNLHFLHVNREKGRTCRACHEVHGSDLPSHLRKSVPFGASGWLLPINFQKTPQGGSCSPGCHKPFSYDNGGATLPALEAPGGSTPGK